MSFLQVIEFQTDRIDQFNAVVDEWLTESAGWRTATRATTTQDPRSRGPTSR